MTDRDENLILLKLQRGDQDAYEELYNLYAEPLYRFIYFRVGRSETAEDLMHDVFVKFISRVRRENISQLRAYLYRIAKNLVIDYYRSTSRDDVVDIDQAADIPTLLGKSHIEASADLEITAQAIFRLKPMWREIVILRYVEGMSHDEIASVVGRPSVYVRVNLHRAIKTLKQSLTTSLD